MLTHNGRAAVLSPEIASVDLSGLAGSHPMPAVVAEDARRVFVDRGLVLRGEFSDCNHLAIAGHVESDVGLRTLVILEHGSFKGRASVGNAYIAGRYEGVLTVEETLVVGPAAHISGSVQCGTLQLEDGGKMDGDLRILAEEVAKAEKPEDAAAREAQSPKASPGTEADATDKPTAVPGFDEAEATLKSVLERDPKNLGALASLGHLARQRGDRAAMYEFYTAALALEPMNITLRVEVARAFKKQGDVALARQILESVLSEPPAAG